MKKKKNLKVIIVNYSYISLMCSLLVSTPQIALLIINWE